jgi:saccharopine dehydrogenase-like NADP-dependent oxidoreductase
MWFDELDSVSMRVGALPQFPTGQLKYNLTWSTDGLINEYCNPCDTIHNGRRIEAQPLEGLEEFSLDGVRYEAFNTSGGIPLVFGALSPAGLTQASGEAATGTQQTTFAAMNLFLGLLTDPFVAGRGNPVPAYGLLPRVLYRGSEDANGAQQDCARFHQE